MIFAQRACPSNKSSIYLRLSHRESDELLAFLKEKQESGDGPDLLEQLLEADADYKARGLTVFLPIELEKAIELEAALKTKVPTADEGWTPLHYIRMSLMVSLEEHKRHAREKVLYGSQGEDLASA